MHTANIKMMKLKQKYLCQNYNVLEASLPWVTPDHFRVSISSISVAQLYPSENILRIGILHSFHFIFVCVKLYVFLSRNIWRLARHRVDLKNGMKY